MRIEIRKFGTILVSRPAGREAFLAAKAYTLHPNPKETIELDFSGVDVMAPSWADEFISGIKQNYPNQIVTLPSKNASVIESLKMLGKNH